MDGLWRLGFKAESLDDFALSHKVRTALQRALDTSLRKAELFVGTYGNGKSSVARFLSHQISNTVEVLDCASLELMTLGEQKRQIEDFKRRISSKGLSSFFDTSHKKRVLIFDEWHNVDRRNQRALSNVMDEDNRAGMIFTSNSEDGIEGLIRSRCGGALLFDVVDTSATTGIGKIVTLKSSGMSTDEWRAEILRVAGRYVERGGYVVDDDLSRRALDENVEYYIDLRMYFGALQVAYEEHGEKK